MRVVLGLAVAGFLQACGSAGGLRTGLPATPPAAHPAARPAARPAAPLATLPGLPPPDLQSGSSSVQPSTLFGGVVPGNRVRKLLDVAYLEWRRWGSQVVRVAAGQPLCAVVAGGTCERVDDGCGREQTAALCPVVDEYWEHIRLASGESFSHDCSRTDVCEYGLPPEVLAEKTPAWSAAFISTVMHRAGFTAEEFLPSPFHANYVVAARDGSTTAYTVVPTPAYPAPADIVCTTRFADQPQFGPDEIALVAPHGLFSGATPMHCDLVVAVDFSRRLAHAIGGNVMQAVSMNVIELDPLGRVSPLLNSDRPWLLVMRLQPAIRADN